MSKELRKKLGRLDKSVSNMSFSSNIRSKMFDNERRLFNRKEKAPKKTNKLNISKKEFKSTNVLMKESLNNSKKEFKSKAKVTNDTDVREIASEDINDNSVNIEFDNSESSEDKSGTTSTVISETGSTVARNTSRIVTAGFSDNAEILSSSFSDLNENVSTINENVGEGLNRIIEAYGELSKISLDINKNTYTKGISKYKSNFLTIDSVMSGFTLTGGLIQYMDSDSPLVNGVKENITSLFKNDKSFMKKTVIDIPGISNILLSSYDKIRYSDKSKIQKSLSDIIGHINKSKIGKMLNREHKTKENNMEAAKGIVNAMTKKIAGMPIFKGFDRTGEISTANAMDLKSKVSFDAETHTSINVVVMGYLSKILSVVGKQEEILYDYRKGLFRNSSKISGDIEKKNSKKIEETGLFKILKEMDGIDDPVTVFDYITNNDISRFNVSDHEEYIKNNFTEELFNKIANDKIVNRNILRARLDVFNINNGILKSMSGNMINAFNIDEVDSLNLENKSEITLPTSGKINVDIIVKLGDITNRNILNISNLLEGIKRLLIKKNQRPTTPETVLIKNNIIKDKSETKEEDSKPINRFNSVKESITGATASILSNKDKDPSSDIKEERDNKKFNKFREFIDNSIGGVRSFISRGQDEAENIAISDKKNESIAFSGIRNQISKIGLPTILGVPAGIYAASEIYTHVLPPILALGQNIGQKMMGLSTTLGSKVKENIRSSSERTGGFFHNVMNIALGGVAAFMHLIGNPIKERVGALSNALDMLGFNISNNYDDLKEQEEEAIGDISAAKEVMSSATASINDQKKNEKDPYDYSDEQEKFVEKAEKDIVKDASNRYRRSVFNSPEMRMFRTINLADHMIEIDSRKNGSKIKKGITNEKLKSINPSLLDISENSGRRTSGVPSGEKKLSVIGRWFDRIGGSLLHDVKNMSMSGPSIINIPNDFTEFNEQESSKDVDVINGENADGSNEKKGLLSSITAKAGDLLSTVAKGTKNAFNSIRGASVGRRKYDPNQLNLEWSNTGGRDQAGFHPNGSAKYSASLGGFNSGKHYGIDLRYPQGAAMKTPSEGTFYSFWNSGGGGNTVLIVTPDGWNILFMHLSRINSKFKDGDFISCGEQIGNAGGTGGREVRGSDWNPHLHFQVQPSSAGIGVNNSKAVDPEAWLRFINGGTPVTIRERDSSSGSSSSIDSVLGMSGNSIAGINLFALEPFDFEKHEWRGTITGRKNFELSEEEKEAINERLNQRLSKQYGVPIDELRRIDEEKSSGNSKGNSNINSGNTNTDNEYNVNNPSIIEESIRDKDGNLIDPKNIGKYVISRIINNNYDNSVKNLTVNNMNDITNNYITTNNYKGVEIIRKNPFEFSEEDSNLIHLIDDFMVNISSGTGKMSNNIIILKESMMTFLRKVINSKNTYEYVNPEDIASEVVKRIGMTNSEVGKELEKEINNEFSLNIDLMGDILMGY